MVRLPYSDLVRFRVYPTFAATIIGSTTLTDEELARVERHDRIVEVEEVQSEIRAFRAIVPVIDFRWEGRNIDGQHTTGICLAKMLARSSGLHHLPETHDLQTKQ